MIAFFGIGNIKMKNILIVCLISIFMCSGCTTTLYDIQRTDSDNEILINEIYYNEKIHGFQVFQVLDDGILVRHPGIEQFIINYNTGIKATVGHEYFLDAYITPILNDYVDEQNLRTGWYKYIGVFEYNTIENKKRKVRHFIEVEKE